MSLETQKMELRSTLKALNYHRSVVACRIYESLGGTGEFFIDELDLNDPRISDVDKDKLMDLNSRIYINTWELDKLDCINEPERHDARQKVFELVDCMTLDETIMFLQEYGCSSTLDLVEKVIQSPGLLDGVMV